MRVCVERDKEREKTRPKLGEASLAISKDAIPLNESNKFKSSFTKTVEVLTSEYSG
jgi:hypothetical protein